ncbi:F-box protein [Cinnamomum micranthum f. kanehirae]|uniref:F-box protein n=1 Tax=Cinnamomum micranthum f. kanehirae TaxID=337451 RepID=A0A443NN21_9MAGN|nr:F-box protein [Cinnamomum micranthum f. kanehirae]
MALLVEDNSSRNPMRCVDKSGLSFEFSLGFLNDHVRVRASCNGLLFCSSMKIDRAYYVCNPMTREFKLLPVIEERRLTKIVGLAVDPYTQRYNVVLAVLADSDSSYVLRLFNCLLFDSETNVWKKLVLDSFGTGGGLVYTADQNQVVSVGRSLYCLSVSSKILVFDLFNEAWKEITPPAEIAKSCTSRVLLLELEGSLSVTNISGESMNIWVLKDCLREEWELADRVNLGSISEFLRETAFPVTLNRDFIFLRTFRDVWVFRRKE